MILNEMVHDVRISRIGGQHRHLRKRDFGDLGGRSVRADMANLTDKTEFRGSSESLQLKSSASRAWTEHFAFFVALAASRRKCCQGTRGGENHWRHATLRVCRGCHLDEHQSNSAESSDKRATSRATE